MTRSDPAEGYPMTAPAEIQSLDAPTAARTGSTSFMVAAALAALAVAAFVLIAGQTQLWYDESNYLVIAQEVKRFGLPEWYWLPGQLSLFLDSPPALFYFLSLLPVWVLNDPLLVRAVYAAVAFFILFASLCYHLRGTSEPWPTIAATAVLTATTGYLLIESIQVRMDLPLSALTFAVLTFVAEVDTKAVTARARGIVVLCMAIFAFTLLAYLTKYQAVCLSGSLLLWGLTRFSNPRKLISVGLSHILGVAAAAAALMAISWIFGGATDTSILDNLRHNFGRIFAANQSTGDYEQVWPIFSAVSIKLAIPTLALAAAALSGKIRLRQEPLLALCVYLSLMVAAFNIVMFRMPGGGDYYMAQAAVPLAYITSRSIVALVPRERVLVLALVVGAINLSASLPLGYGRVSNWGRFVTDPPQRWSAGLPAIQSGLTQADQSHAVADALKQHVLPGQAILMDDWQYQAHTLGYWLDSAAPSGYLLEMQPEKAAHLLGLTGTGQVGAIAFAGREAIQTLQADKWKQVWQQITANFVETPIAGSPDWHVYLRRQ